MNQSTLKAVPRPIEPAQVRYIKLGQGGKWERECLDRGIVRFGFGGSKPGRFERCLAGRWAELKDSFIEDGRNLGTATRFTNETRLQFEDDGSTLWITFVGERLCWGQFTNAPPQLHADGDGVWRSIAGGWRDCDVNGEPLVKDALPGVLTKLVAYRGTSCKVDVADYVVRRINGIKNPAVEDALAAQAAMKQSILTLMQLLGPQDFETLVDLVFTTSGWRRLGVVGRTQKTLDLDLVLPSTGERAFVQVKSRATSGELARYVEQFDDEGPHDRMFFVFHTGEASTEDDRVTVIGPERLAELVLDAGLANWVIRKVS